MEFEWFWYINVESSLTKKKKNLINNDNGGGYACVGAEVY